jgi:hypothetical protein
MFGHVVQVDGFSRPRHLLQRIHVAVDRDHQNFSREYRVLRRSDALVLRARRIAGTGKRKTQSKTCEYASDRCEGGAPRRHEFFSLPAGVAAIPLTAEIELLRFAAAL